jgi:hypothetical protein
MDKARDGRCCGRRECGHGSRNAAGSAVRLAPNAVVNCRTKGKARMADLSLVLGVVATALSIVALAVGIRHLRELRTTQTETHTLREETRTLREETLHALGLHQILVRDTELLEAVKDISTAYAVINDASDPFFRTLARRELMEATQRMQSMSGGRLTVSEEEIPGPITFAAIVLSFAESGDEFSTSALAPPSFWRAETSYLEQNRELRRKGVKIRRTFIFDNQEDFSAADAQWEMTRQQNVGIEVLYSIAPPFEPRDIIVLKKPGPDRSLEAVYAGEILLRRNKTIASINIWSTESNPEKVMELTRTLEVMMNDSDRFVPGINASSFGAPGMQPEANSQLGSDQAAETSEPMVQ